jgi:hypothetical protein
MPMARVKRMTCCGVALTASLFAALPWSAPGQGSVAASALSADTALKPAENLTPDVPPEVEFEETNDQEKNRPFFDDFSWKSFIALNWPADEGRRGVPHPTKTLGDASPAVVWESWKSMGELFPADPVNDPPTPWDSFDARLWARRRGKARKGEVVPLLDPRGAGKVKVLQRISKLEDINQAGFMVEPEFPLVAQNKTFVRYEIRINRTVYDFVRDNKYYLRKNLPVAGQPQLQFRNQSITVKAAWRELPDDEAVRKRYYRTQAQVLNWKDDGTPFLTERTVGLVGLHIVHKTPKRRNWVWSTFEHVDNTELGPGGTSPPSFCSKDTGVSFDTPGTNKPPPSIPAGKPIPPDPTPVEVARFKLVHPTTDAINRGYQGHRQVKDTVWSNYRLVVTQWPAPPGDGPPFPKSGVANVTMETYHQIAGCINCHQGAQLSEFVFFLEGRAVNSTGANDAPKAVENVRKLLEKHRDKPKQK